MQIKINHDTHYSFDSEVFLEPHYLRFQPRSTVYSQIQSIALNINPLPEGNKVIRDEENNILNFCWFGGKTQNLTIKLETIIETRDYNPFDFIVSPFRYNQLPFGYSPQERKLLHATLAKHAISEKLYQYGIKIQKSAGQETIPFLTQLTDQLHQDFSLIYREEGEPWQPDETFVNQKGSCRDLAWMQIMLLRHLGIASRFVSGYYYFDMEEEPNYELHAWVEVFLPGAGWVGLDPSHGILTGNTHLPFAVSAYPEKTMPVTGSIRGAAKMTMQTDLMIRVFS
ncbi:transglutaminase family protein [Marivirga sp.]|uniref:transglutaminase family protein n=1 Tax=Marivirga sp. TaxID=2018662 RepID=UPI0025DA9DC3|nr:transglutaminase family protein [Marivirga sp.]